MVRNYCVGNIGRRMLHFTDRHLVRFGLIRRMIKRMNKVKNNAELTMIG